MAETGRKATAANSAPDDGVAETDRSPAQEAAASRTSGTVGSPDPTPSDPRMPHPETPKAETCGNARIHELARPKSQTDALIASIADQLCAIVDDDFDFKVTLDGDTSGDTLQVQKLTVLINSLLENVRRSIGGLSELAEELEAKVRERTERLDLIVKSSNDGVWLWNIDTGEVEYSPRWRQLLGLDDVQVDHIEDWLGRVHPEDQERLRAAIRAHLQGTQLDLREDYRIQHADGTYRWVWCRGRCQRDAAGRAFLMAGTQTDVHQLRSVDASTGMPNEESLIAQIDEFIGQGTVFRMMVVGVPRVISMKQDMASDEMSTLRSAIAKRLSAALPFTAFLAHLSGDFYATLVPEPGTCGNLQRDVIDPLLTAFDQPFQTGRRAVWLDVAIGATMPVSQTSATASDVMRDAWTSYRIARNGDVRSNILDEMQVEVARDRAHIQQEIRRGLDRGWFVPFFQPIICMATGQPAGFETLCRMEHPDLGLIAPSRFIPVAEDLGLMDAVSHRMLDFALAQLGEWEAMGAPFADLFLTVNLDAQQIMAPNFATDLADALESRGISPANLKIEIVESSIVGNFSATSRRIARIREIGVRIALDDFGTGYSSLEYLNRLSFDLIKIDKAFMDGVEDDQRKRSMVEMICVLARMVDAQICIEGIETKGQAEIARALDVEFGQGYVWSKPLPRDALFSVIGTGRL